jgi:hypothetical protein
MRGFVAILLILIYLSVIIAQGDVDIPVTSGGARISSSGGGSRSPDIENFIRQVESWKTNYPDRFDYLKKLLYKEPFTTETYKIPAVLIYYLGNTSLNRSDKLNIDAYVINDNPIEIRRALYLTFEEQDPGSKSFKQVNPSPQIIQTNEYREKYNDTTRTLPDLTSFQGLKSVGQVKLRIKVTDGQYDWYSSNTSNIAPPFFGDLILAVKNNPPTLNNISLIGPNPARYNDPLDYVAIANDPNGDMVNVTLHVLDEKNQERKNESLEVKAGEQVAFRTSQYGFFGESDSGKNFTYYYTYGDGINITNTSIFDGPHLKTSPKLWVENPRLVPEDENYYWWQKYNFGVDIANQNPGDYNVTVTLYVNTPSRPWEKVDTKVIKVTKAPQTVSFEAHPFDVSDTNQSFSYKFKFSEYEQHGNDFIEASGAKINSKVVPYAIYNPLMVLNLASMLILIVGGSLLIERKLKRGVEAQENLSGKSKGKKMQRLGKSGKGFESKISNLFRRS